MDSPAIVAAAGSPGAEGTAIDESNIIAQVRLLLPPQPPTPRDGITAAPQGSAIEDAEAREQAGTLLWDLSGIPAVAEIMVHQAMIFPVLEALISAELMKVGDIAPSDVAGSAGTSSSATPDPGRPVEVALGILGNLAAHDDLALALSQESDLLDLVAVQALHTLSSSAALAELCRLASTALRKPGSTCWRARLSGPDTAERLVWIAHQSRDPVTHARALDLMVSILHAQLLAQLAAAGEEETTEVTEQQQQQLAAAGEEETAEATEQQQQQLAAAAVGEMTEATEQLQQQQGRPDHMEMEPQGQEGGDTTGQQGAQGPAAVSEQRNTRKRARDEGEAGAEDGAGEVVAAQRALPGGGGGVATTAASAAACLLQAGLLPLVRAVLEQATKTLTPGVPAGPSWAGFTPLPAYSRLGGGTGRPTPRGQFTPALGATPLRGGAGRGVGAPGGADAGAGAAAGTAAGGEAGVRTLPMSEASVDAALRVVEVVGGLPEVVGGEREVLLADAVLAGHVVQLLHCAPGEQVLASTLLALQALSGTAVTALASSLSHVDALLDCLGELPSGEKGAWQRELVVYLMARACQAMAAHQAAAAGGGSGGGTATAGHTPEPLAQPARASWAAAGGSAVAAAAGAAGPGLPTGPGGGSSGRGARAGAAGAAGLQQHLPVGQAGTQEVLDLATRVEGLEQVCGVSGSHVTGYLRAAARGMLALLEPHATRAAPGSRLRGTVQKVCLALKERLV